jgi:putative flippase GtrA
MVRKHINRKNTKEVSLYLLTGGLGLVVDLSIFSIALWLGIPPLYSQWAGAGAGAINNSLIHHYFVFTHTRHLRQTVLPNTLLSLLTVLASGPALLLLEGLTQNLWVSKIIVLGLTAVVTYFIRKLIIFQ